MRRRDSGVWNTEDKSEKRKWRTRRKAECAQLHEIRRSEINVDDVRWLVGGDAVNTAGSEKNCHLHHAYLQKWRKWKKKTRAATACYRHRRQP